MEIKLNLIPPEKREEIAKKNQITIAIRLEFFLTTILVVFLAVLLSFNYILNLNLTSVQNAGEKSETSGRYDRIKEFDENFSQINRKFSNIISIEKSQLYWSKVFLKLSDLVFPGIKITAINTKDYLIILQGISDTRDNLSLFKDKLTSEECFSNINLPLANLINKDNVTFQIDFAVNKNCLKDQ